MLSSKLLFSFKIIGFLFTKFIIFELRFVPLIIPFLISPSVNVPINLFFLSTTNTIWNPDFSRFFKASNILTS